MKPIYVAKRSGFAALTFWRVLACILIIPIFYLIYKIIDEKSYRMEFYDNKVVCTGGFWDKKDDQFIFLGVLDAKYVRPFWGRIFNYGDITINCVGKWDINKNFTDPQFTTFIKKPKKLQKFLQTKLIDSSNFTFVMTLK